MKAVVEANAGYNRGHVNGGYKLATSFKRRWWPRLRLLRRLWQRQSKIQEISNPDPLCFELIDNLTLSKRLCSRFNSISVLTEGTFTMNLQGIWQLWRPCSRAKHVWWISKKGINHDLYKDWKNKVCFSLLYSSKVKCNRFTRGETALAVQWDRAIVTEQIMWLNFEL